MNNKKFTKQHIITILLLGIGLGAKAIDGYTGGKHVSGIDGTTVYLNDLEDHTWTYYSGVDESVDGGYYKANYNRVNTAQGDYLRLYSPNPRNVTIEYDGNGGAVSIEESQTKFIYFETLEESATSGEYKYQVISNPFSKRPTKTDDNGNKVYQGFKGWLIEEGGDHIKGHSNGDTLSLDENIVFDNLATGYTTNCMSDTIKLVAQWTTATTQTLTATGNSTISFTGGTYETNLVVMKASVTGTITVNSPCTIMMVEPDGSKDYRSTYKSSGTLSPKHTTGVVKMEWTNWKSNNNICSNQHNLTLGRGLPVGSQCAKVVYGINANCKNPQYTIKVESGKYNEFYFYGSKGTNGTATGGYTVDGDSPHVIAVAGNDYDRATGNNDNLLFVQRFCAAPGITFAGKGSSTSNPDNYLNKHTIDAIVKSGKMCPYIWVETSSQSAINITHYDYCFYLGNQNIDTHMGGRNVLIEGGELCTVAGGSSNHGLGRNEKSPNIFTIRMKGGIVHGSIYGGGGYYSQTSDIIYAITGGTIVGWVAGGCNGTTHTTSTDGQGEQLGISYEYVGGKAEVNSNGSSKVLGAASLGGYVYGAGSGRTESDMPYCGKMTYGTNVVIADDAYVERNVFAGGNYGFSDAASKIYVTGGTVGGGVFGDSNMKSGKNIDIYMTGGIVKGVDKQNTKFVGGVYGGSNTQGTLSGNVNIKILGGQVGTEERDANVHGGGYGSGTNVTGDVDVTIGSKDTKVYGNVYGGGADGKTNTDNKAVASITKHTNVTMTGGTINGSLFGAGKGTSAASIMNPVVTMSGGTVTKNVFGSGDAAKVDGNTSVKITGPSHVGNNVYGGGNAAEVSGTTKVQIGDKCDE